MLIGFIIWTIGAVIFFCIGISCKKSREAVGFFTFVKPPTVPEENIKKYNHAVSLLWFLSAALFEIIGIPLLWAKQNSPVFVFMTLAVFLLIIAMMIVFLRIETKYK